MTKSTVAYSMAQPELLNAISGQLAAIFTNMTTQIAATVSTKPTRKLFDDYMDEWFSLKSQNLSQKTLEDYQGMYNTHIMPKFSGIYLDEITASGLDRYYSELLQKAVEGQPEDDAVKLQRRVLRQAEWILLPEAVRLWCAGAFDVRAGRAHRIK